MKTLDDKIEQTLKDHSKWSGSEDALWGRIATQLQPGPTKLHWRRKPMWIGAAAATVLLAFMLHSMYSPLPPNVPEMTDLSRMQPFSLSMLVGPEVYRAGEDIELTLYSSPYDALEPEHAIRVLVWKQVDLEETLACEILLGAEEVRGQDSLWIQGPSEEGLYRLVVEGTFTHDGERIRLYAEKTILIEGEKSDETFEKIQP